MSWNIANAKQQFSEVVRLAAEEPQAIYNREKPVAVIISVEEFEEFKQWRIQRERPTIVEQFAEIRALLAAEGFDGIEVPPRANRPSPFDDPNYLDN